MWELLYADDLALTAEIQEEVELMFGEWRRAVERRGLKVNLEKTKMMVTGGEVGDVVRVGRYPCGVCGRGVGANSVLCTACGKWRHKRCSGLGRLNAVAVLLFWCPACARGGAGGAVGVGCGVVGELKQFCYLGDVLECGGGSERAIRARVGTAWGKWKEMASLLVNRGIPLHHHGKVYEACIRSVMLYGGETWALTARLEAILFTCDRRMFRYMAGVTWRDCVMSVEVARRCGVWELGDVPRVRRLGWFGHVVRREETEILGKTQHVVAPGWQPPGRPKKTRRRSMKEELASLNLQEEQAQNRDQWKRVINCLTS